MPRTDVGSTTVPRRRWTIALLLGFGVLVNYFDRVNLSVSQEALHAAFGISTVTFGYLLSAYSWSYALLQLPSGLLLDRFGVRLVSRVSTILWSVASFGAAAATGIGSFFGARLLLGIGEAPTFPANAKAIGYWFPAEERSLATAIFDAAAKFSSAIGVPLIGILLIYFGWRWSFAATGLLSLAYFALFYFFYRNPSEDSSLSLAEREFITQGGAQPEDRAKSAKGAPLIYLLRQRKVCGLTLGFAAYNYSFYLPSDLAAQLSLHHSSCGLAPFRALYERAVAVCHLHRSPRGRMARGCAHPARLEFKPRPSNRSHWRNEPRAWSSRRRKRAESCDGAFLDQCVPRRFVRRRARGVVDSLSDRTTRKRRHTRRNT